VKGEGVPKVLKQKGGTAWVDGDNVLGAVVGNFCTDLAIRLAQEHGIGWVVAKNSNHYGICQHYGKRISQAGMVVSPQKPF
jgi:LDH2 family malate/lactate/ureidoglycolate dehydrogenase